MPLTNLCGKSGYWSLEYIRTQGKEPGQLIRKKQKIFLKGERMEDWGQGAIG